jgi:hypothetical protein
VIFAILSVFLFSDLTDGQIRTLSNLSNDQKEAILKSLPAQQLVSTHQEAAPKGAGATESPTFMISFRTAPDTAGVDFGKQLLVLIGTLVTAVSSFYFGSKAAGSNAESPSGSAPVVNSVTPSTLSPKDASKPQEVQISGDNLDLIKEIKAVHEGRHIVATDVTSSGSTAKCKFDFKDAPSGQWDIVVTDTSGRQGKAAKALTTLDAAPSQVQAKP